MSEDGSGAPKTLADVSHLFFSGTEGEAARPDGGAEGKAARVDVEDDAKATRPETSASGGDPRSQVFVVTGGDRAPGKSTVAVNLAAALSSRGRSGIFDADPRVPNARFYLGLPSWHYLSPLTGEGTPAPATLTDSGLVVVDWTNDWNEPGRGFGGSEVVSVEVPEAGRHPLDFAVVDAPVSRVSWMAPFAERVDLFVVVAGPERSGFDEAFRALAVLARDAGVLEAGIVVNRAPSTDYAEAFFSKLHEACERLLPVRLRFLGGVVREPGIGSEQRERGAIVGSRPDAVSALLLRKMASNALGREGADGSLGNGPTVSAWAESDHEDQDPQDAAP
jgi:MinD-like ATPase involved in chromosome partitioning or flagellar assembly